MALLRFLALTLALAQPAQGAAPHPLGPHFPHLQHPSEAETSGLRAPGRSEVLALVAKQTPVKSQKDRGTCTMFADTALLESLLVAGGHADSSIDLSVQWLQYLVARHTIEEGSSSDKNFEELRKHGQPRASTLPYEGDDWLKAQPAEFRRRCGHLRGRALASCRVSHLDPALIRLPDSVLENPASGPHYNPPFASARREARALRERFFRRHRTAGGVLTRVGAIKRALSSGIPLALDFDYYYGAWNDPDGKKYGLHPDEKMWSQGVVAFPEPGTLDRSLEGKELEGHSVLVVGYDDHVEVAFTAEMPDHSRRVFRRRGVYYFKNSWGTDNWGRSFALDGHPLPGYGVMLQDYAHRFGQFYRLRLSGGPEREK